MFMVSTLLLLLSPKDSIEAWPFLSKPPNRATIYRNLYKFRMFHTVVDRPGRGRKKTTRTEENVERILNIISTDIFGSLSYISCLTKVSRRSVGRVFKEKEMTSYKVGHVQQLKKERFWEAIKILEMVLEIAYTEESCRVVEWWMHLQLRTTDQHTKQRIQNKKEAEAEWGNRKFPHQGESVGGNLIRRKYSVWGDWRGTNIRNVRSIIGEAIGDDGFGLQLLPAGRSSNPYSRQGGEVS